MKKGYKSHDHSQQHEPRSSSSCAACKMLKRRCGPTCTFAPYFRADEPKKFAKVHKVFGASNVSKLLNEVPEEHREDAVSSLTYEAEARLRDPVYGCLGPISFLYRRMVQLQHDLALARARLAQYSVEARAEGGGVGGQGSGSGSGDHDEHNHLMKQQELPNMWNNGLLSESGSCSQVMSLSPNANDFGQVPLLPL